jgi:hypothetical protein
VNVNPFCSNAHASYTYSISSRTWYTSSLGKRWKYNCFYYT